MFKIPPHVQAPFFPADTDPPPALQACDRQVAGPVGKQVPLRGLNLRLPRLQGLEGFNRHGELRRSTDSSSSGYQSGSSSPSSGTPVLDRLVPIGPPPASCQPERSRICTNPHVRPHGVNRPSPAPARQEMPAEMIDTLLAGMYRSFDTHIRSTKSSGANLPGAEVIDDLCRWAFGKEENGLPTTRCQGRLLTALAIMTTEGRHAVKGLTVTDSLQDGTPLLLELPPRSLLSRTRAACERLSLILRVGHDSVQDPAAFADSVKAVSRTTLAVTATRKGRLPDGTAVPHIHQLDLSGLNDQGQDLFQFPGEFGRDLREMPHLRRIRAPESWSGNEDFREVCHCARVDIEWLDPSGLGVGRSCCRGVGNAVARLLRACRS